ncbi:MAG: type II toxin-antitoxin system VapC family toxin [Micropepsaceae bacterium]
MTRYLLDTHVYLWSVRGSNRLKPYAAQAVAEATEVCVSVAALWEACIKAALQKLELPSPLAEDPARGFRSTLADMRFRLLTVEPEHAAAVRDLPHYHRDPFDRIMMAQAMHEGLTLVTHDDVFDRYAGLRTLKT